MEDMKRTKDKWNKDDSIITFYFTKFGTKNLPVKDVFELIQKMGVDLATLQKQSVSFDRKNIKTYTKIQKNIIEEFGEKDEKEFRQITIDILENDERHAIAEHRLILRQDDVVQNKKKEDKKKLDSIFRKMGKDPSKFKSLGVHKDDE
jgi:hypothetical protein